MQSPAPGSSDGHLSLPQTTIPVRVGAGRHWRSICAVPEPVPSEADGDGLLYPFHREENSGLGKGGGHPRATGQVSDGTGFESRPEHPKGCFLGDCASGSCAPACSLQGTGLHSAILEMKKVRGQPCRREGAQDSERGWGSGEPCTTGL